MKKVMLLLLFFTYTLFAQMELLPKEPSIIEGQLPNGFKYSIMHNSKPKKRAELRLLVKIGSLEEEEDEKGVAHFIEHMAFNGSTHFKKNELIEYLESIGVQFGGDLNAYTGFEQTVYKLTVPLKKDNLDKSLLVFSDWAGGITFDEKEFDKERGVILEEERSKNGVWRRIYHQYNQLVYGDSLYAKREPIGEPEIIKTISVQKAKAFYKKWYRPELMHFVAVGDFNTTMMEQKIKETFSSLENSNHTPTKPRVILENNTTRIKVAWDKELTSNSLNLYYMDSLDDTRTKEDLRDAIIEGMMIRLFNDKAQEQLEKRNPKATVIDFDSSSLNKNRGYYVFSARFKNGDAKAALGELYQLMFSFKEYGFSQNALKRLKEELLSSNEKAYRRVHDQYSSSLASDLLFYAQNKSIFVDYDEEYKLKKELIQDINFSEINSRFRTILDFKDRVVLFKQSQKGELSLEELSEITKRAKKGAEDLTKEKSLPKDLTLPDLNSSKIIKQSHDKKRDIHFFTLENGIEVAFKKTDFTKDSVAFKAFSFGGESLYDANELLEVSRTPLFVEASGVGEFSALELDKILSSKSVSVDTGIFARTEGIDGGANSKDIESMFALLYLRLTQPKIDKKVTRNIKNMLKIKAEELNNSPQVRFSREAKKYYHLNYPRIQFETKEAIEDYSEERMLSIFKERFADMNNFKFIFIGDIPLETIERLSQKYLGNLPTQKRQEHFVKREEPYRKGEVTFKRDYNSENISNVVIQYKSKVPYDTKTSMVSNALEEILQIRLRNLIREDKSGVYGINAGVVLDMLEVDSSGTVQFSCDPKREDELIKMVYSQIEKIKNQPVTKEELEVFKKGFSTMYETFLRKNYFWMRIIENYYKKGIPLETSYHIEKVAQSVTAKDILALANKIFSKDRIEVILNPKK